MTHKRAPHQGSRANALLAALHQGPATFYQVCERANIDIDDSREEDAVRTMLGNLVGNTVCFDGLLYRLAAARTTKPDGQSEPSGQVAGPAHRGIHDPRTVFITRRPEGARA